LRPAMTTSNNIIAGELDNVLYVPLECLHSDGDSLVFVYKKNGMSIVKQQVMVGQSNDNEVVILQGLAEGDAVYLSVPKNAGKSQMISLTKSEATLVSQKESTSATK
jgi:HlyD family secretion protein